MDVEEQELAKHMAARVQELMTEKPRPLIIPLPCPLCKSEQVQACIDANNPMKDFAKCRICHCTAPLKIWNKPRDE